MVPTLPGQTQSPFSTTSRCAAVAIPLLLGLGIMGCKDSSDTAAPAPAATVSPEQESFTRIVNYMRHMLVEPDPARPNNMQQFPANPKNATPRDSKAVLTYDMKVDASPQVIPPANPGEPYRGKIAVTMVTAYSRIVGPESDEKIEEESGETEDQTGTQATDSAEGGRKSNTKPPKRTVVLEPREERVEFDLEYVDGQWRLASEEVDTVLTSAVAALHEALQLQQ